MIEQRVSFRYARALLETAVEGKVADQIHSDFSIIDSTLHESHEFRVFTASPVIQHWRKKQVYTDVFKDKISPLTMNFLLFLLDKKRGELIRSIIYQYEVQYNVINNRIPVEFVSVVELTDELKKGLESKVAEVTKKTVLPSYSIKQELLGGMLIKIDDKVFDSSISHQLELLHKKLVDVGQI